VSEQAPEALVEPFWESAARGVLSLQHCSACERFIHFPLAACPTCHSPASLEWRTVSGLGTLYSFIVVHRSRFPAFSSRLPYVVGCVELDEQIGLRLFANLMCDSDQVEIGMPVEVVFEQLGEIVVPQFRPVVAR